MAAFVEPSWLRPRLDDPKVKLVDPRPVVSYLQGHIKAAINLPVMKIFDEETLQLLPVGRLAKLFGVAGIDLESSVVLYDSYDGQSAAMLAWALEYLGHADVRVLAAFFEKWVEERNEVYYKPIKAEPRNFRAQPKHGVRALISELKRNKSIKLIDVRSKDEYLGADKSEVRAGHLPGAINLPWTALLGKNHRFLPSRKELERVVLGAGVKPADHVVTYCRTGPRAAIGYYALRELGYQNVRLYDGSFHQWAERPSLPVEVWPSNRQA